MSESHESPSPLRPALPPISRRGLLGIGAATIAAFGAAGIAGAGPAAATSEGTVLPLVDPLPAGAPDRTQFDPHEQVFASYLMILAPLANSVVDDDPELYGWMEDGWWRTPNDPINSRIMEHVATLAWFLTHDRPWNPYYLDANLTGRLDAALGYYLSLQGPRGAWPVTYESESLATTGFGLVSLAHTYRDLDSAGLLPARLAEIDTAMRAAAVWLMDLDLDHWNLPLQLHNQLVGGLAGVGHAATVTGDPGIAADLADRIELLVEAAQAPAGYFHEPLGYDHGYNFAVALPDVGDLYEQTGNPLLVEHVRRWADFAQYVVLPEPNAPGFVHLGAASMRNSTSVLTITPDDDKDRAALGRVFVPEVPLLAAFHASSEAKAAARAAWAAETAPVEPRAKGDTSPRLYAHVPQAPDNVTAAERDDVVAALRPVAEPVFTEYRTGTIDQQLLFVRRPGYYLATLLGNRGNARVRSGPGLFWHPAAGSVIASFNNAADDHWTTLTASGVAVAQTNIVSSTFHDGEDATAPVIAPEDLGGVSGVFTGRYVAHVGKVTTDVTHRHDGVVRSVSAGDAASELVPLLVRDDDVLEFADGTRPARGTAASTTASGFSLTRGDVRVHISWGSERSASLTPSGRVYLGALAHHLLRVEHDGDLTVEVTTVDVTQLAGSRVAAAASAHAWTALDGTHRLGVHVVNLENEAVDVRVTGPVGPWTTTDLAPGAGAYRVFRSHRPLTRAVAVVTTRGRRPRIAVRRLEG
ncbi:hypothetical protein [Beutenbergia cavernae]|uniref:hypothetical protein n=1 Tax=Beutenbergia cavernae TaxID=84757 RepID=UPI00019AD707|nr:hypothetical protein [Beutenbergia cavernae]